MYGDHPLKNCIIPLGITTEVNHVFSMPYKPISGTIAQEKQEKIE